MGGDRGWRGHSGWERGRGEFSWGKDSGEQAETVCRRKGIPGGGKDKSKGK